MFISKLEMIGFKSFAAKSTLEFRPGVMAVVGPNGCGKTNIVDAVRWVLGEQRSSTLRAERMESVIFNGTEARKPLGMSEVTLTIDDDKGLLPSPYTEIALTRRLFRSGESEYLINRNPSRLRDISDLFVDTGLGNNAYSIIELAMVEGIISGPSDARRALLEEAAGVAKYKSRRQSALRRLSSTKENLARVEDIYLEVEKTYKALKRQASKARRYQAVSDAIKLRLLIELSEEKLDITERKKPLEENLRNLEEEHSEAEAHAVTATSELLSLEGKELSLIDRINRSQDNHKRLERRHSEQQSELALAKQRMEFLKGESENASVRREALENSSKTTTEQETGAKNDSEEIDGKLDKFNKELKKHTFEKERITTRLSERDDRLQDSKTIETDAERKLRNIKSGSEQVLLDRDRLERRRETLDARKVETELLIKGVDEKTIKSEAANNKLTDELKNEIITADSCTESREKRKREFETAESKHAAAKTNFDTARIKLQAHRSRPEASAIPETLQMLIKEKELQSIADRIDTRADYESAVTAYLNSILDAYDITELSGAEKIFDNLDPNESSILRISGSVESDNTLSTELPPDSKGCVAGPDLISGDGELADFLRNRLRNVVYITDLDALKNHKQWASENNITLVTQNGELLEPDGIFTSAVVNPELKRLGWQRKDDELSALFSQTEKELHAAQKEIESRKVELEKAEQDVRSKRENLNSLESQKIKAEREIADLRATLARHQLVNGETCEEIEDVLKRISGLPEIDIDPDRLVEIEAEYDRACEVRNSIESEYQELEKQRQQINDKRSETSTEIARLSERKAATETSLKRYQDEVRSRQEELAKLESKHAEGKTEMERVQSVAENSTNQIKLADKEISDITASLDRLRDERIAVKKLRDGKNKIIIEAQNMQNECLKAHSKLEAEYISLRERLREVDRRLSEETDVQPSNVREETPVDALQKL